MYLIEYFKTNGKTYTLKVESYKSMQSKIESLLVQISEGNIISFNVEILK